MDVKGIVSRYGKKYSDILHINLKSKQENEIFKWFIASLLLGKRINETLAIRTYKEFEKRNLLSFDRMKNCTWEYLVETLDAGGCVRYDFSTASTLMEIMGLLGKKYGGALSRLHEAAEDACDLEVKLQEFKGIGPVTANIFLREMRGVWSKADPPLGHLAKRAARELGIADAKEFWRQNRVRGYDFVNFETALMRLGREARRRKCTVKDFL